MVKEVLPRSTTTSQRSVICTSTKVMKESRRMSRTERWPPSNQDEGQIRTEMLENPNTHHWKGCYDRVTEIVRWQMLKAGLPRNLQEDIVQEAMLRVVHYLPF